jgi:hypothetical protein
MIWLNRDPIEEVGGLNLYGFINNNPMNQFDALGQAPGDWIPLIGTWLAYHYQPKGSKVSDYSYTLPSRRARFRTSMRFTMLSKIMPEFQGQIPLMTKAI